MQSVRAYTSFTKKVRMGPSGVHLFDRSTGLNVLLDEVIVPQSLWSLAPRQVSIALTNACDLTCPHCFVAKYPASLNVNLIAGWLDELNANGCLGIGFGGGEPALYPYLADLCYYAAQKTGLAVTLTTHSHLLDDALLFALCGNVHFVRVSMDGIGATYESIRGRPFADLCQRLEAVRILAPFGINYIVNARTLPDLDTAVELAANLGAAEFLLLPEQPVEGKGGIDACTMESFRRWVSLYKGRVPLTVSEAGCDGLPTCNPLADEPGLLAYAHIDASGVLKRTSFDNNGVVIDNQGVMKALSLLSARRGEQ